MGDSKEQANKLKVQGNEALSHSNFWAAVQCYTQALALDSDNAALYSNRSVAYARHDKFAEALDDAEKAIELNPTWAKAHLRKGAALQGMQRYEDALMAYMAGFEFDSTSPAIKQGISECKAKLTGPQGSQPLVSPFADSQLWEKIRADSNCRGFLNDPEYKRIIEDIQKNPASLGQHMQDARIMTTLGMLLGVGLTLDDNTDDSAMDTDSARNNTLDALDKAKQEAMEEMSRARKEEAAAPPPKPCNGTKEASPELNDSQKQAQKAKELGNAAYKKKDFDNAIQHYDKAIELDPTNITFRTNKAAVYFEKAEYDQCITVCEEAVEVGRDNRADFKLIAKAFTRIGNAYNKKEDYENALKFYNKSLSESRDPEVAKKVQQIQKSMAERERLSYLNPDVALEEKSKGNGFFTKGDYPSAIKHYTEAIKRNPEDCKVYSNRAACYTKLAEFPSALKDAEECIRLDPKFIKGYLRKGNVLLALKQSTKAGDAFQKALELDATCQEAVEGYRKSVMLDSSDPEEVRKRAMQNPEVQAILADPAMQLILQQMQKDPRALQEHLKNPEIAKKIEKLLECGLIAIR